MMESTEKETLTADDLDRVCFRAEDEHGHWESISAKEATDKQFDTWAKSRIPIQGEDKPWSPVERADFCNMLWQVDSLVILKKDVEL
jgi:hypothetical protein